MNTHFCNCCKRHWHDFSDSQDLCDDCFDEMLEDEELDMKAHDDQQGRCYLCSHELGVWFGWNMEGTRRALCADCSKRLREIGYKELPERFCTVLQAAGTAKS